MGSTNLINLTISVPNGTVTHDDGHVLCVYGNSWRVTLYIATFFAANYIAHAATIKSNPGDRTSVTLCNMVLALFFPVSGLMRAVNAIVRFGRWGGSDLENACRAGALCMVVRVHGWLPTLGQTLDVAVIKETWTKEAWTNPRRYQHSTEAPLGIEDPADHVRRSVGATVMIYRPTYAVEGSSKWLYPDAVGGRANVQLSATKVHGTYSLPQGYGFAILPRNTHLLEWSQQSEAAADSQSTSASGSEIACTYSLAKALVSIIQTLAAFTILIGHRDDVIRRWGYASFHLTILPYLVMTIFNFVSNVCTADYDGLYMVETPVMDEARRRGGIFEGTVAATYTATTRATERLAELTGFQPKSFDGLQHSHANTFALRFAAFMRHFPLNLLKRRIWTKSVSAPQSASIKAVSNESSTTGNAAASRPTEHDSPTERSSLDELRQSHGIEDTTSKDFITGVLHTDPGLKSRLEEVSSRRARHKWSGLHTCQMAKRPWLGSQAATDAPISLLSDDGVCYIPRAPKITPNSIAAIKEDVGTNRAERLCYHANNVMSSFLEIKTRGEEWRSNRTAFSGLLSSFMSVLHLAVDVSAINIRFYLGWSRILERPCAACVEEKATEINKTTIYFPMCHRFLRRDDGVPKEVHKQDLLIPPMMDDSNPERSRSGSIRYALPVRKWHRAVGGIVAQITIGILITGLIATLIGWQSEWFSVGNSSLAQRVVMLLWMCEGVIGTLLAFLSLREVMLTFFVFPLYVTLYQDSFSRFYWPGGFLVTGLMIALALVPLTIFVPPIWGLVIVGQMLTEWGKCVTLYT